MMIRLARSLCCLAVVTLVGCEDPALLVTFKRQTSEIGVWLRVCHAAPYCDQCTPAEDDQNVFEANVDQSTLEREVGIFIDDPPSPFDLHLDIDVDGITEDRLPLSLEGLEWPVRVRIEVSKSSASHTCPDNVCGDWTECQP